MSPPHVSPVLYPWVGFSSHCPISRQQLEKILQTWFCIVRIKLSKGIHRDNFTIPLSALS